MDRRFQKTSVAMARKLLSFYLSMLVMVVPMNLNVPGFTRALSFMRGSADRFILSTSAMDNTGIRSSMKSYRRLHTEPCTCFNDVNFGKPFDAAITSNQSCFIMHDSTWYTVVL